jgi:hypothetical protein
MKTGSALQTRFSIHYLQFTGFRSYQAAPERTLAGAKIGEQGGRLAQQMKRAAGALH